ncbi:MAG: serine hydrolase [Eubacteriales bacterium]|nr:serine hydrolase [Eubacteriales bacterium]
MLSINCKKLFCYGLVMLLSLSLLTACFSAKDKNAEDSLEKAISTLKPLTDQSAEPAEAKVDTEAEAKSESEPAQEGGRIAEIVASSWPMANPQVIVNSSAVAGLADAIESYLQARGLQDQRISIVYENLITNQRYDYRGDERYLAASTVKVPMAMVVYQMMHEQALPVDLKIAYTACDQFIDDGYSLAPEGTVLPIRVIIEQAIRHSGNTATSAIFKYFHDHGEYIHNVMDSRLGMKYGADTTMSATEGIRLMEEIYYNPENVEGYNELLRYMKTTSWNLFFNAHLEEAEIAHKYGLYNSNMHDIGIVYAEEPYAFAVYTESGTGYQTLPELGWIIDQWHRNGSVNLAEIPATKIPDMAEPGVSYDDYYQNTEYPEAGAVDEEEPSAEEPEETTAESVTETEESAPIWGTVARPTNWWDPEEEPIYDPPSNPNFDPEP